MKGINSIINTLSKEERERLKNLIEECQLRENNILKTEQESHEVLKKIAIATEILEKNLNNIPEKIDRLAEIHKDLDYNIKAYLLQSIPDHNFYNA